MCCVFFSSFFDLNAMILLLCALCVLKNFRCSATDIIHSRCRYVCFTRIPKTVVQNVLMNTNF